MKFSKKQLIDLESIEYFIGDSYKEIPITGEDRQDFLLFSDKGIIPENRKGQVQYVKGSNGSRKDINLSFFTGKKLNGYQQLFLGKSRRGLHVQLWEDGIMDGTHPIYTLMQEEDGTPIPKSVMEFMKKSLFSKRGGMPEVKDMIQNTWEMICEESCSI